MFADNPDLPIICADWEKGDYWNVCRYDSNGLVGPLRFEKEDMLTGALWGNDNSVLLVEAAHLAERSGQSTAQVFYRPELEIFSKRVREDEVEVIAFPHKMSEFARYQFEINDDKGRDPEAIMRFFLMYGDEIPMHKWKLRTTRVKAIDSESNRIRREITTWLNELRESRYDHASVSRALEVVSELNRNPPGWFIPLKDEVFEHFMIYFNDEGQIVRSKLFANRNAKRLMTLYVCVFDEEGKVRRKKDIHDSNGEVVIPAPRPPEFIGIGFIWSRLLLMSPYHGKSGTARANLMYQGLSNFDKSRISYELVSDRPCRRKSCKAPAGTPCNSKTGRPHMERTSRYWPESAELRQARIVNRRLWRSYQKSMLRALHEIGKEMKNP